MRGVAHEPLAGDTLDPEAGIPEFKHSAVAVEPAVEAEATGESDAAAGDD